MLENFVNLGRVEVGAVSAAISHHRKGESAVVHANLGYASETLAQLDSALQNVPSKATRKYVRAAERRPLFWNDEGFWDAMPSVLSSALNSLHAEGYRQGVSIRLTGQEVNDMSVLHVSFPQSSLDRQQREKVRLLAHMLRPAVHVATRATNPLTARQIQVLTAASGGMSNNQIADQLMLSRRTVATHFEHIYQRLGTSSRVRAIGWAAEQGLIESVDNHS